MKKFTPPQVHNHVPEDRRCVDCGRPDSADVVAVMPRLKGPDRRVFACPLHATRRRTARSPTARVGPENQLTLLANSV